MAPASLEENAEVTSSPFSLMRARRRAASDAALTLIWMPSAPVKIGSED
jgi:hypothetical protein